MKAYWIPATQLEEWWPKICHLFHKGLGTHQYFTFDAAIKRINDGDWKLWVAWDEDLSEVVALAPAYFAADDAGKLSCSIAFCSATRIDDTWLELISAIETWAKDGGCKSVKLAVRKGWVRLLAPMGYETSHVEVEKELSDG